MKIYIVRHTSVVLDGNTTCYGFTDVDVRPSFEQEARLTRQALQGLSFDRVFSSPLSRARKLATYVGYPDATLDERLKEMNFGEWEGRTWTEIIGTEEGTDFFEKYITTPIPGGESLEMQYDRVKHFFDEQKLAGHGQILVFCHGGVINCARAMVGAYPLREAFLHLPEFGSVTELDY